MQIAAYALVTLAMGQVTAPPAAPPRYQGFSNAPSTRVLGGAEEGISRAPRYGTESAVRGTGLGAINGMPPRSPLPGEPSQGERVRTLGQGPRGRVEQATAGLQALHSQPTGNDAASRLLRNALRPTEQSPGGSPITLEDAIRRAGPSPASRAAVIKRYWALYQAIARYQLALDAVASLQGVTGGAGADDALLRAARAATAAEATEAQLTAEAAQRELGRWLGSGEDSLPLPADGPLVGEYLTRFPTVFRGRPVRAEIRRIDQSLPMLRALLQQQAEAALAYEEAVRGLQRGPASQLLPAHQEMRKYQQAFLLTVYRYNAQIADYAMEAGGYLDSRTTVSMLIHPPAGGRKTAQLAPLAPTLSQVEESQFTRPNVQASPAGGFAGAEDPAPLAPAAQPLPTATDDGSGVQPASGYQRFPAEPEPQAIQGESVKTRFE